MTYHSHADLGGQLGHGPVIPEPEQARFHAPWEARALALTVAMGATGAWNLDMARAARETLAQYARLSYYAIWIGGLQKLLLERALVSREEIETSRMIEPGVALARRLQRADVPAALARGSPTERPAVGAARFECGEWVRTRADAVPHHTRLPGYVRGRRGRIGRVHGCHVFADAHARGLGEQPQWLYSVEFDARELWGEGAAHDLSIAVDAWEPYLEAA